MPARIMGSNHMESIEKYAQAPFSSVYFIAFFKKSGYFLSIYEVNWAESIHISPRPTGFGAVSLCGNVTFPAVYSCFPSKTNGKYAAGPFLA
jgi:hypothetical protein